MDKVVHSCTANKYQVIKPTIGGYQCKSSLSRRDAVLINRLRIGHTRLTHFYLLSGDDQPVNQYVLQLLVSPRSLIECVNFAAIRSMYILVLLQ